MIVIRNYELEIERAKKEIIETKREAWRNEYIRKHKISDMRLVPEPPIKDITPRAFFITSWKTGFVVCDFDELMKLPKRRREKILALGGIW
ncbi:MAG: hypothetical protein ACRDA4_10695 [Filifactoraceae bacterium]